MLSNVVDKASGVLVKWLGSRGESLFVTDGAGMTAVGYGQDTTISAASALPSIPAGARVAIIQAQTAELRWRDDGTDPTASIGMVLAAGDSFLYTGDDLSAVKVISATGGINVSYYS